MLINWLANFFANIAMTIIIKQSNENYQVGKKSILENVLQQMLG